MKKNPDTLEDLVLQIECANSTLLILHSAMEGGQDTRQIVDSLYATYLHIDRITKDASTQLLHIDQDVLIKAAEAVHND